MNWQSSRRILLPYVLILIGSLVLSAVFIPLCVRFIYAKSVESGLPPDFSPLYLVLAAIITVAAASAFVASNLYANRILSVVRQLTDTTRLLGEGKYHSIQIPRHVETVAEIHSLSQTLEETAAKVEGQISALSTEQVMLSTVLAQMTDGVLIANHDDRVQLLNAAGEKLFGFDKAEALGRSVIEVIRHHALVDLWTSTKAGEQKTMTLDMWAGHKFLQVIGIPLGNQLPGRSMLLFQDLTQLHRLEIVRKDFMSNISHELRTPLTSIHGFSEILATKDMEREKKQEFYRIILNESERLSRLITNLLNLSKIEAGIELNREMIDLADLIEEDLEFFRSQTEEHELTCLGCTRLPQVYGDRDRIHQIINNLLSNAIKYSPQGGKVEVETGTEGKYVTISVTDHGMGIPGDELPHIFERFRRIENKEFSGITGTGLGLAIVKNLVELHGGKITVRSEPGQGSTFTVHIPIRRV